MTNLPSPPNSLIGRQHETRTLSDLLRHSDVRLVTLTGTGGAGKTRLALQVASELDAEFPDGTWFVSLAAVRDPQWVPNAIAQTLNIRETSGTPLLETLKHTLAVRRQLVLLDNFEQILGAVPFLTELLGSSRYLKFLVTSRAALHAFGEYEYPVPWLGSYTQSYPDTGQHPAVTLFAERARAVQTQFNLTPTNLPTVLELCRRLDYLPLAIELAAAHSKLFAPDAILARLDNRLNLLTKGAENVPARQQTLRGALDWSYELLTLPEQVLLARMGIFRGGATWDAIAAVSALSKTDVLECVTALMDQSLLRLDDRTRGETRVTMLETIREYAREKLAQANDLDAIGARHFTYYAGFVANAEEHLWGREALLWLQRLENEHDNLRAALDWGQTHADADAFLNFNCDLARFWMLHNHFTEGAEYITAALARRTADPAIRGHALRYAADLEWRKGQFDLSAGLYQASADGFEKLNDPRGLNQAHIGLALVFWAKGEHLQSRALLENALVESRALSDIRSVGRCLNGLGELARWAHAYADARALHEENLSHHQALGDLRGIAIAQLNLGLTAIAQKDYLRGQEWMIAASENLQSLGERQNSPYVLKGLAEIVAAQEKYERAALLLGAMDALCQELDFHLWSDDATTYIEQLDNVRAHLSPDTFERIWNEGMNLSIEQALARLA